MDEATKKRIEAVMAENQPFYEQRRRRTVRHILEQRYIGRFAVIEAVRKECGVKISWKFGAGIADPSKYYVTGVAREMSLVPDPSYDMDAIVAKVYGDGFVQLELQEGCSYYFEFHFNEIGQLDKCSDTSEYVRKYFDVLYFQVAVPLADEHKHLLKTLDRRPEERVRHAVGQFLSVEDAFDEELKNGIEQIKSKKLPPEEEEERISRLVDKIKQLKEFAGQ
jgi:predicted transcriptional regulator